MYIIFNRDGSIKKQFINDFIQQGDNNSKTLSVAIVGTLQGQYEVGAVATLPDGTLVTLPSENATFIVDGVEYEGKEVSITSDATILPGVLKLNLVATNNNVTLVTYTLYLTINETGLGADDIVKMTVAEYQNLLNKINQDMANFVPYTGALNDTDLGSHDLSARKVRAYTTDAQDNDYGIEINDYGIVNYNYGADFREDTFMFPEYDDISGHEFTIATEQWVNAKAAIKAEDNTFTADNTFVYSPQTNEHITDASADTKLATKKYVKDKVDEHLGDYAVLNAKVGAIESKIPTEATPTNKLADKDFVNSTVNSLAAFYITKNAQGDPFDTYAELSSATIFYSGGQVRVPTRNDYCMVNKDENHDDAACRYIFQGVWGSGGQWEFQFVVNETAFTADQIAAINSGITTSLVGQITTNANSITSINSKMPIIKDFVIATTDWQLDNVSGRYYALLDAGNDFVIDDNKVHLYTGTSESDNNLIGTFGIIASSDETTQKIKFECFRQDIAPESVINYTVTQFGGN